MQPEDVLWRIIDRLEETKEMLDQSISTLHPKKDKDVIDAIAEVEQLTHTQLNICRRIQRRLERYG